MALSGPRLNGEGGPLFDSMRTLAVPRQTFMGGRVNSRWLQAQDLNLRAQVVWRQTASPVIGIRFAVTRLRFPDRPQTFPV
jgi:hypothetical protein